MPRRLIPNSPIGRIRHVAKVYAKRPKIVLDTILVTLPTVGIDRVPEEAAMARTLLWMLEHSDPDMDTSAVIRDFRNAMANLLDSLDDNPLLKRGTAVDFIIPWVSRELAKFEKVFAAAVEQDWDSVQIYGPSGEHLGAFTYQEVVEELQRKGSAIALWAKTERIDILKKELPDVLEAIAEFEVEEDVPQGKIVYEWPDGWTMQKLTTAEQLAAEGEVMQHCVGAYCEVVERGLTDIFSLRDNRGRPHATIEYAHQPHPGSEEPTGFLQIMGKQNEAPKEEYAARVRAFIRQVFDGDPQGLLLAGENPEAIKNRLAGLDLRILGATALNGLDLSHANLHGAQMAGMALGQTDLSHADLREAYLVQVGAWGGKFHGANLAGANLEKAYLQEADLSATNLEDANLFHANLERANLHQANLRNADVRGVSLVSARITSANFTGADLGLGSELEDATWDRDTNFEKANLTDLSSWPTAGDRFIKKALKDGARLDEDDIEFIQQQLDVGS